MKHSQQPPTDFKTSIRNICQQPQLDDDTLEQLLQLQNDLLPENSKQETQPWYRSAASGWATSLILVLGLLFILLQPKDHREEIAYEVVKNHLKLKPLDIKTQSMSDIRSYFTQLDFSPVHSEILDQLLERPQQSMLGGRYCSVKGVTAAQLRFQENEVSTFYQVPYQSELHGDIADISQNEEPDRMMVKGLEVSLWQEKGLLMILISSP